MTDLDKKDQDWLNKNISGEDLPEAPASATCKVESPNGFQYLFTLRASSGKDLLTKLAGFELKIINQNWKPLAQWQPNGKVEEKKPAKTKGCPKCGGTMTLREGISKKTGKRWAAWFCDNPDCEPEFINFSSKI